MKKTFCIGDVHGCYYTLVELLSKIPSDSEIIFVGDLCDKGNFSKDVIQLIIDNNYLSVKGNHDDFITRYLFNALTHNRKNLWSDSDTFGGNKTILSYKNDLENARKHIDYLNELPIYIMRGKYFITHGFGLPYFNKRDEFVLQFLSNRVERPYPDWEDYSDLDIINIFGHTSFDEILQDDKFFGIDTGCVYGNKLSAFELGTHQHISVDVDPRDIS